MKKITWQKVPHDLSIEKKKNYEYIYEYNYCINQYTTIIILHQISQETKHWHRKKSSLYLFFSKRVSGRSAVDFAIWWVPGAGGNLLANLRKFALKNRCSCSQTVVNVWKNNLEVTLNATKTFKRRVFFPFIYKIKFMKWYSNTFCNHITFLKEAPWGGSKYPVSQ